MLKLSVFNKFLFLPRIILFVFFATSQGYSQNISITLGAPITNGGLRFNSSNISFDLSATKEYHKNIFLGIELSYISTDLAPTMTDLVQYKRKMFEGFVKCAYHKKSESKFSYSPVIKIGYAYVDFSSDRIASNILSSVGLSLSEEIIGFYQLSQNIEIISGIGLSTVFLSHPITLPSHFPTTEKIVNQFKIKLGIQYNF